MKLLLTFLILTGVCFGQSKKVQIIALNNSIDSLNTVLKNTRDDSAKEIGSLNDKIKEISNKVTNLQTSNTKLKTDLAELSKKNLELEAKFKVIVVESSSPIKKLIGYWAEPKWCCQKNGDCNNEFGSYDMEFIQFGFDSINSEYYISLYENSLRILDVEANASQNKFIINYRQSGDYQIEGTNTAPNLYPYAIGSFYLELNNGELSFPDSPFNINFSIYSIPRVKCE